MTTIRFIGDVHGKYDRYKNLIRGIPVSRQVGDMGVGFSRLLLGGEVHYFPNPPHDTMKREGDHKYIRGNHDNLQVCKHQSFYIEDGSTEEINDKKIMYVGGALSIDRAYRTPEYDYWHDEELSHNQLLNIFQSYIEYKPDVMITHDCPEFIANMWLAHFNRRKIEDPSRTRFALDYYFNSHKPKFWIYGHWHNTFVKTIDECTFICLGELEYCDLNMETMEVTINEKSL